MRLTKTNFSQLAEFIEDVFPTFKVPMTTVGIATWVEDLSKYELEMIFKVIQKMYRKEKYFNYHELLKGLDHEVNKHKYDHLITNRNYKKINTTSENEKVELKVKRLDFENRSGKLEKANFDKLLENVEVIND